MLREQQDVPIILSSFYAKTPLQKVSAHFYSTCLIPRLLEGRSFNTHTLQHFIAKVDAVNLRSTAIRTQLVRPAN
jgi:hypothetical protein